MFNLVIYSLEEKKYINLTRFFIYGAYRNGGPKLCNVKITYFIAILGPVAAL